MKIQLNGQEKNLPAAVTISTLLQDMGLGERRVAVEVNREIVPRSRHNEFQLKDNDRVEVVFAIGGGSDMSRGAGAPRSGDATGELAQAADGMAHQISRAFGGGDMSRGAGAPRSGDATGELAQAADGMAHQISRAFGGGDMSRGAGAPRSGDATGEGHRPPTTGDMVLQRTLWRRRVWR